MSSLNPLLDSLKVPSDFSRYDSITDDDLLARLACWKNETQDALAELRDIALKGSNDLTLRQQAQVVSAVALFDGDGPWVTSESLDVSRGEHWDLLPMPRLLKCHLDRNPRNIFSTAIASPRKHFITRYQAPLQIQSPPLNKPIHWSQITTTCGRTHGISGLLRRTDVESTSRG